jgi:glycerol-3-phosphate dehydrogenase
VVGTYAGLRPLIAPSGSTSTVKVSREHRVSVEGAGLVRVSGGKYTTYRVMAADAVDAVLGSTQATRRPSATAELPLIGAATLADLATLAGRIAEAEGIGAAAASSLVDRHGTEAEAVLAAGAAHGLNRPLAGGFPYLESEVAWAVEHELAQSLDDVLARRIRVAPELRDRGAAVAPRVAEIMGDALGWDAARRADEVTTYLDLAHRQFDVPELAP